MKVRGGPFAGMRYVDESVGSAYLPKLLGIYERELNGCIEQACALSFPLIVDIGAAEGYYAVGMALRNPTAHVVAFETEEAGRAAVQRMARLNSVDSRIDIHGECGPETLHVALFGAPRSLVICDVEGNEEALLDLDALPALAHAYLLVEVHEFIHRGITERIIQRFALTHDIQHIWQESRSRRDFPYCTPGTWLMSARHLAWAVSEWRPERMAWLWMEPKVRRT